MRWLEMNDEIFHVEKILKIEKLYFWKKMLTHFLIFIIKWLKTF